MLVFTPREQVWLNGHYVLSIEFGSKRQRALQRLWSHRSLLGCYLQKNTEPLEQPRISINELDDRDIHSSLYGIATLPNGAEIACGTACSMNADANEHSWWIDFFVPLAALERVYPVGGYPFHCGDDYDASWLAEIDAWMVKLGQFVFEEEPFKIAVVGFEPVLERYADVTVANVPVQRSETILLQNRGSVEVFPRTTGL